jgi:hypothetical protein
MFQIAATLRPVFDIAISKISESVPADEWERIPSDFSKNVDHYLYGTKRNDEEGSG